jgi:hypothetical protein
MAINAPLAYGRDIACLFDADDVWTEATGVDVVRQDALHRLLTDDVLGDDGTGSFRKVGWGFDVRQLLGKSDSDLAAFQPVISEVLQRDARVLTADVTLTATVTDGLADVVLDVKATTDQGPFSLVRSIQALAAGDLVGQT